MTSADPRTSEKAAHGADPSGGSSRDVEPHFQEADATLAALAQRLDGTSSVRPFEYRDFSGIPADHRLMALDLNHEGEVELKIELGRAQLGHEDVIGLRRGSVVSLDKVTGDPADILANGRLIARGEVLVLDDSFCLRITELVAKTDSDTGG